MAKVDASFARWLDEQLERRGWKPADLVRASGVKPNGRPVIDPPRVGSWLKGERPGPELAAALAASLRMDPTEVMRAAGYPVGARLELAEPPEPVSNLAAVIEKVMRRAALDGTPLTWQKIAEDSRGLRPRDVERFATERLRKVPELEERRWLAVGLNVHPMTIDRAVATDMGFDLAIPDGYDYRLDPDLSDADRNRISAFIEGIKAQRGKRSHG